MLVDFICAYQISLFYAFSTCAKVYLHDLLFQYEGGERAGLYSLGKRRG
jgi:hypothetical protein